MIHYGLYDIELKQISVIKNKLFILSANFKLLLKFKICKLYDQMEKKIKNISYSNYF